MRRPLLFGLLNVDKPPGPTSHDIVAGVRRRLPRGTRVGHAGTLDPFASGVLVLCVGPATRLAEYVQRAPKRYRAVVRLAATSTTDDPEGDIVARTDTTPPGAHAVRQTVGRFVGAIDQAPPVHSAVHVDGHRAYRLARRGKAPPLQPRRVTIHGIDVIRYDWPELEIDVRCGTGTYVRALARDIGAALATGGYCSRLRRTAVGAFTADDAAAPDALDLPRDLRDPLEAAADLPRFAADAEQVRRLAMGQRVAMPADTGAGDVPGDAEVLVVDVDGALVGVAKLTEGNLLRPLKILVQYR